MNGRTTWSRVAGAFVACALGACGAFSANDDGANAAPGADGGLVIAPDGALVPAPVPDGGSAMPPDGAADVSTLTPTIRDDWESGLGGWSGSSDVEVRSEDGGKFLHSEAEGKSAQARVSHSLSDSDHVAIDLRLRVNGSFGAELVEFGFGDDALFFGADKSPLAWFVGVSGLGGSEVEHQTATAAKPGTWQTVHFEYSFVTNRVLLAVDGVVVVDGAPPRDISPRSKAPTVLLGVYTQGATGLASADYDDVVVSVKR